MSQEKELSHSSDVEVTGVRGIIMYLCLCACEKLQGNGGYSRDILHSPDRAHFSQSPPRTNYILRVAAWSDDEMIR